MLGVERHNALASSDESRDTYARRRVGNRTVNLARHGPEPTGRVISLLTYQRRIMHYRYDIDSQAEFSRDYTPCDRPIIVSSFCDP